MLCRIMRTACTRLHVCDLAGFDAAAECQTGASGGQLDGLVVNRDGDAPVTADDLFGLGVRTVGDNLVRADAGDVLSRFITQLVQTDQVARLPQTFRPVVVFL